jgi:RND family efflux transporter MFP subunit
MTCVRAARIILPAVFAAAFVTACGESNTYVAPPPPKVTVAPPVQQKITRYFEATGTTAAVNSANLVARVQGFVQDISYKDGDLVKQGTVLFTIEPEPYQVKLQQAKAAQGGMQATLDQAQADFERQTELASRQVNTKAQLDAATASRNSGQAKLQQAEGDTKQAEINLTYTKVTAPFDGIVTARQVSLGELVGNGSATVLATIVQMNPIHVNFTANERDVVRARADMTLNRMTIADLKGLPVEFGLQTETGFPHKGQLDYVSPSIDASTGTATLRAVSQNDDRMLLPGYFVRVRIPWKEENAVLVPDIALGSDQGGRYVLVVDAQNVVAQRKVEVGPLQGESRVIEKGLTAEDRVIVGGALRAIPGQKVDPQPAAR